MYRPTLIKCSPAAMLKSFRHLWMGGVAEVSGPEVTRTGERRTEQLATTTGTRVNYFFVKLLSVYCQKFHLKFYF